MCLWSQDLRPSWGTHTAPQLWRATAATLNTRGHHPSGNGEGGGNAVALEEKYSATPHSEPQFSLQKKRRLNFSIFLFSCLTPGSAWPADLSREQSLAQALVRQASGGQGAPGSLERQPAQWAQEPRQDGSLWDSSGEGSSERPGITKMLFPSPPYLEEWRWGQRKAGKRSRRDYQSHHTNLNKTISLPQELTGFASLNY